MSVALLQQPKDMRPASVMLKNAGPERLRCHHVAYHRSALRLRRSTSRLRHGRLVHAPGRVCCGRNAELHPLSSSNPRRPSASIDRVSGAMSRLPATRSITARSPMARPIASFSSHGKRRRNSPGHSAACSSELSTERKKARALSGNVDSGPKMGQCKKAGVVSISSRCENRSRPGAASSVESRRRHLAPCRHSTCIAEMLRLRIEIKKTPSPNKSVRSINAISISAHMARTGQTNLSVFFSKPRSR
jgi:hypothetical protein